MRRAAILIVTTALGCARPPEPAGPPAGYDHAYAGPSCAPWDGYAVSLVLRSVPLAPGDSVIERGNEPQLRLGIYPRKTRGSGPSGLAPGTVRWPADPEVAGGALCAGGRCSAMPRGAITSRQVDDDGRLRGHVDLQLADGRAARGTFDAEWRHIRRLCG
jgi:hypothetical protein